MQIKSSAFENNGIIPAKYTCGGESVNPPLEFSGIPAGTQSLVLIMDDPDSPTGTWDHWIVFNIPSCTNFVHEGKEPDGAHGTGTSGNKDYFGPCPHSGEHHYCFTIYAIDTKLPLYTGASKDQVLSAMSGHILSQDTLVGLYAKLKP